MQFRGWQRLAIGDDDPMKIPSLEWELMRGEPLASRVAKQRAHINMLEHLITTLRNGTRLLPEELEQQKRTVADACKVAAEAGARSKEAERQLRDTARELERSNAALKRVRALLHSHGIAEGADAPAARR